MCGVTDGPRDRSEILDKSYSKIYRPLDVMSHKKEHDADISKKKIPNNFLKTA